MTAPEIVKRKVDLKKQAVRLIRAELQDLRFQQAAMRYRDQLAGRIQLGKYDPKLSGRLDAVQVLIDREIVA
jgi:hypothetical protein